MNKWKQDTPQECIICEDCGKRYTCIASRTNFNTTPYNKLCESASRTKECKCTECLFSTKCDVK